MISSDLVEVGRWLRKKLQRQHPCYFGGWESKALFPQVVGQWAGMDYEFCFDTWPPSCMMCTPSLHRDKRKMFGELQSKLQSVSNCSTAATH